jgi:predicted RNase H-like HicB family nuclease
MAKRVFEFSSVVNKDGKWYVATSPELGITSQGRSVELALENLREAIELYLEDEDAKIPETSDRPIVTVVKVVLS